MKLATLSAVDILTQIKWAASKSEARRMLASGGVKIDGIRHIEEEFLFAGSEFIISFGKRKYARIVLPAMKEFYNDNAREEWDGNISAEAKG